MTRHLHGSPLPGSIGSRPYALSGKTSIARVLTPLAFPACSSCGPSAALIARWRDRKDEQLGHKPARAFCAGLFFGSGVESRNAANGIAYAGQCVPCVAGGIPAYVSTFEDCISRSSARPANSFEPRTGKPTGKQILTNAFRPAFADSACAQSFSPVVNHQTP